MMRLKQDKISLRHIAGSAKQKAEIKDIGSLGSSGYWKGSRILEVQKKVQTSNILHFIFAVGTIALCKDNPPLAYGVGGEQSRFPTLSS